MAERGPGESYRPDDVPPSLFGAHQPGIVTPVLDHLFFVALDLRAGDRAELRTVIDTVGEAAESLMLAHAGRVTVTIGFGPELFGARFGLESLRPVAAGAAAAIRRRHARPPLVRRGRLHPGLRR